jgi:16S rRNA (guanine966-N2)-methyltransferase
MRIISGKHKGRRIELGSNTNQHIRPTSEFAREAIFNILAHSKVGLNGGGFSDQKVLDVFCGTGAFGLEALSRGADSVTFIDQSRESIATARHNAIRMKEDDHVEFLVADATRLGRARKSYSLVFLDPPYFSKMIEPSLNSLKAGGWLEDNALLVIEHDAKEQVGLPASFEVIDERRYGRAVIKLIKAK